MEHNRGPTIGFGDLERRTIYFQQSREKKSNIFMELGSEQKGSMEERSDDGPMASRFCLPCKCTHKVSVLIKIE